MGPANDGVTGTVRVQGVFSLLGSPAKAVFLPAYSPDFNPIEKMWSKVKNTLRSAEARTPEDLHTAIGQALAKVTANDARNWFASCGYNFI